MLTPAPFRFVHVPKTGGLSICRVLSDAGLRYNVVGHKTIVQYEATMTADEFSQTTFLAVIRNPFDRLVSAYFFGRKAIRHSLFLEASDFGDFVCKLSGLTSNQVPCLIRPQVDSVTDSDGAVRATIWPFEKLDQLAKHIIKNYASPSSVTPKPLPHINKSNHRPFGDYYTSKLTDLVRQIYTKDFALYTTLQRDFNHPAKPKSGKPLSN